VSLLHSSILLLRRICETCATDYLPIVINFRIACRREKISRPFKPIIKMMRESYSKKEKLVLTGMINLLLLSRLVAVNFSALAWRYSLRSLDAPLQNLVALFMGNFLKLSFPLCSRRPCRDEDERNNNGQRGSCDTEDGSSGKWSICEGDGRAGVCGIARDENGGMKRKGGERGGLAYSP